MNVDYGQPLKSDDFFHKLAERPLDKENLPRLLAVSTANSPTRFSQKEILHTFQIENPQIRSLFLKGGIEHRYLTLPPQDSLGNFEVESQGDLIRKHKKSGLDMSKDAITECLRKSNLKISDIDYLCCVSSTGFITPGFSALLIKQLGFRQDCARLDVVGMGCNAGLNALNASVGWAHQNPGKIALMVCIEVCSATYLMDESMETAVVNSLFGDGAAAVTIAQGRDEISTQTLRPAVVKFSSWMIPQAIDAMRFDWNENHGRFSFFLDPEVPYVVGANVEKALNRLLADTSIRRSDISHWLVHSGGKKVIDSIRVNLGLSRHDVRHTLGVLRDFGNVSSGSFLFSYERLCNENVIQEGNYGIMITMGPGSTIEMVLLQWK